MTGLAWLGLPLIETGRFCLLLAGHWREIALTASFLVVAAASVVSVSSSR